MSVLPPHIAAFAIVVFFFFGGGDGFNLDTEVYTRHRGDPGSMFGFSVSMHREAGQSWVLVGAPKAQTSQPGVTEGGAVYACEISHDDSCSQIPFDPTGSRTSRNQRSFYEPSSNTDSSDNQLDNKSQQWFGATVYSAGEDGPVVACAPRYIYFSFDRQRREPVGTCFVASNQFKEFLEYSPCRTRNWGQQRQGSCQIGLSASISRDGKRLFIGAVGSRYWQGELYSVDDQKKLPFVPPLVAYYNEEGMIVSQNLYARQDVISTPEGPSIEDDSYMGYSMTSGDFGGSVPGHEDVAVGRPRAEGLRGQVLLFTWNTTSIRNITGEQLGAYFGYAITTGDIDGDKRDDLIIGAPFYTDMKNNEDKYETGRVYIIYQGDQGTPFNAVHVKDGKNSKGRFGLSLASLGDINKDGFGDFAVGAPYDGPDERGAVYIYHGSASGVRDSHSQVIFSENIVGSPSTFGFSIAGKMDLDENEYPDLIVGAYDSNTVVYLRAKPIVKVEASIWFAGEGKQIALDERNCTLRDRTKVPCIQISRCFQYDGIGVDETLDFELQFVLDSKKMKNPRMFFLSDENKSVMNHSLRLNKKQKHCRDMFVFLKPNIKDKLTSIDAEMRYSLLTNYSQSRRLARQLTPILDLNQELSRKDSLAIKKNCGKDNICIPDLRLIAEPNVKRYLLGSGERLNLNVLVQNEGEDAFEATFETSIPPGLNYVKIERIDDAEREIPVQCSAPSFLNNNTLHCDIGNPLPREKLVEFRVILQPYHLDGMNPRYEFHMNVNSTNPENSTSVSDNYKKITVHIWVETDLILHGSSHPADVHYNLSLYEKTNNFTHESEIGPQVVHVYDIRNKGPSDIIEGVAYFLWPSYTLAGDHLLYLLEQPETLGNIKCDYVEEVNVENIALDRKKKSFLDPHSEIGYQASLHSSESDSSSSSTGSQSTSSSGSQSTSSSKSVVEGSYTSSSSFSHSSSQGKVVTEEEKRKIEEEITRKEKEEASRATGDGSFRQSQRSKGKIAEEHSHYSSNGGRLVSEAHSRPVLVEERGRVEISKVPVVSESSYFQQGARKKEGLHSGNKKGSTHRGGSGVHSYYEEKEEVSNSTWKSGQTPKTSTISKWKTIEDGVEKSGSNSQIDSGTAGGTINLADLGLSSVGNRKYTIRNGDGGRFYSEEKHHEKNTTWNSLDGVPRVSESSSWKTNEDGVIRSGSSKKGPQIDEQTDKRDKTIHAVTAGSSSRHQSEVDRDISRSRATGEQGGISISEEKRHRQNLHSGHRNNGRSSHGGTAAVENRNVNRTNYSEERYHGRISTNGEEPSIASRRVLGEGGIEETNSHTQNRLASEHHRTGTNTESHRTEDNISSGPRKSEGRHKVHWSSGNVGLESQSDLGSNSEITGVDRELKSSERVNGQGTRQGGGTSYIEERHHEWNTSWNSADGGRPKTTEVTNWKINEDGVITNGSNVGTYEGTPKIDKTLHKHITVANAGSGGIDIDQNFVRTGNEGTAYSEEKEVTYNTTWNSARGGRPITRTQSTWKVNKDGKISSGSSSDVYEGTAATFENGDSKIQGGSSYEFKRHGTNYKENKNAGDGYHEEENINDRESQGIRISSDGSSHHQGHGSLSSGYDTSSRQGHISSGSESSHQQEHKRYEGSSSEGRHGTRHEGSRHHSGTTNINVSDLLKENQGSGSQSAGFNQFGDIARGPSDGVARTYGLDLGTLGGSSDRSGDHGTTSESDSRSRQYSSARSGASTGGTVTSNHEASRGYSYRNRDRIEGGSERAHSSWSSSQAASADGDRPEHGGSYGIKKVSEDSYRQVSDDATRGKFQLYPRYKRETSDDLETSLNCGPTECTRIKCTIGPLKKDEEVSIAFRSRVWVPTMKKLSTSVEVGLSSLVAAKVTKLPHIGSPDVVPTHSDEVRSKIMPPETGVKPDIIALWIVVVSACAGAIILMLLVYLLYKCGFFKRNRPSNAPEKQPLKRNGHYHGDEAL